MKAIEPSVKAWIENGRLQVYIDLKSQTYVRDEQGRFAETGGHGPVDKIQRHIELMNEARGMRPSNRQREILSEARRLFSEVQQETGITDTQSPEWKEIFQQARDRAGQSKPEPKPEPKWKELDSSKALSEGVVLKTGDASRDELKRAEEFTDRRLRELEESEQDDSREYKAMMMMQTALFAYNYDRGKDRLAVSFDQNGNLTGAGRLVVGKKLTAGDESIQPKNGHVSHIGTTQRGAGKYLLASLIQQAKSSGLKTVTADASPDAVGLMGKFGFERSGPDNDDGTPMRLKI